MSVLRRVGRRTFIALVAAIAVVTTMVPAQAHTALLSAHPAAGERLGAPPRQVILTFNEPVSARLAAITLTVNGEDVGALGVRQGDGPSSVVGAIETARVPIGLGLAEWVASYRVTSDDGHPVAGTVTFQAPLAEAGDEALSPAPAPSRPSEGDRSAAEPRTSPGSIPGPNGGGQSGQQFAFGLLALSGVAIGCVLLVRARRHRSNG